MADFYDSYSTYKGYATPQVGPKHMARFEAEIWRPAACTAEMSFLELGCGTGAFLDFLRQKGVTRYLGVDHDQALADIVPAGVKAHFRAVDIHEILDDPTQDGFDRVVLLDVLEHFAADQARDLLIAIGRRLNAGGQIVIKVPNAACPWGLAYQFGDLTHRTAFTPLSLRQLADSAGFRLADIYPQRQGSRRRMITDALVHRFLSWALLNPPPFWSANLYAILAV